MHSVWAVAANTIRQALRMKVAVVFIVLLLVILPVMAFSASGDGTIMGRLQTFVSYGISLTSFLLSLLTIFTAIHTFSGDIKDRQIYTVLTKPIRRYQYLLGKCLGILCLDLALLVFFCAGIYAVTVYGPDMMGADDMTRQELSDQFFTARASLFPKTLDVTPEEIEAEYQKLKNDQTMDQYIEGASKMRIKDWLYKRMRLEKNAVAVGAEKIWEFQDVKVADPNGKLYVRFKFEVATPPEDDQIYSQWAVGDIRPLRQGKQPNTRIYEEKRKDPVRMFREFVIPADAIAADGYVAIAFLNPPINQTVVMFMEQGDNNKNLESQSLAILFKAGTFRENFLRGVCVVFFRLVFLAALASMASTFLSFPVAVLLSLVTFFTVSISGFVLESFTYMDASVGQVYDKTISLLIQGLPQFDKYNPSTYLIDGRLIDAEMFNWASWTIVWAALLMGVGLLIFSNKELARDTS
jgi:ABC-type transport system involved in multi-copper enzyme maturation permease subunit